MKTDGEPNYVRTKDRQRPALRLMLQVMGPDKLRVILILVFESIQALGSLALAMEMRDFINSVVAGDVNAFCTGAAALLGLMLLIICLGSGLRFLTEYTSTTVYKRFQLRELQGILDKSYSGVSSVHSGEWQNRINSGANVVSDGATNNAPSVFSMCVRFVGAPILLVQLIPEASCIIIFGSCALGLLTFLFRGKLKKLHKDQQEAQGEFRVFLQERQKNLLVICYCGYRILNGTLEYGTLIAVMNLIGQVQLLFANLSGYVPQCYAKRASTERLMEVEGFADAFVEDPHPLDEVLEFYDRELVSIDFRSVSFSYDSITNATSGETGGGRARSQKEGAHELLRIDPQGLYHCGNRPIWLRQEYHAQGFDVPLPAGRRGRVFITRGRDEARRKVARALRLCAPR